MKAMNKVMLVLAVVMMSVVGAKAQMFAEDPNVGFTSTSSMVGSGSSLPSAAASGVMMAEDSYGNSSARQAAIRKDVSPLRPPSDPSPEPIGEGLWILLLLAGGFAVYRYKKIRDMKKNVLMVAMAVVMTTGVMAVPAIPGWQVKTQPDGTTIKLELRGDEFYHYWADEQGNIVEQDATGYWRVVESQPSPERMKQRRAQASPRNVAGYHRTTLPTKGLVILVNFSDVAFQSGNTQEAMQAMMNGDNYNYDGATGSARKYFYDQSNGQYNPQLTVVGPVTVSNTQAYYGGGAKAGNDKAAEMVMEACKLVEDMVDFNDYKKDNYTVDYVYVIFAGHQENEGAGTETIWAHNWNVTSAYNSGKNSLNPSDAANKVDGLKIGDYACSSELSGASGTSRSGIGTFVHEFSHVLGLPDLYDSDGSTNGDATLYCPKNWSPLGHGNYLNNSKTPCGYSIYDKYFLGWTTPTCITESGRYTLPADGLTGYQINSAGVLKGWDYTSWAYYLENRQQSGWDQYLPGHGMLVWKVQYQSGNWTGNLVNAFSAGVRCSIIPADGDITGQGDGGDTYPGTSNVVTWTNTNVSAYPVYDITEQNGVINFNLIDHVAGHRIVKSETGCTIVTADTYVTNGTMLSAVITPTNPSDMVTSVTVTLGSTTLVEGTDYTLNSSKRMLTILGSAITGADANDLTITATAGPRWVVKWVASGEQVARQLYENGAALVLPSAPSCGGKTFVGWTATQFYLDPLVDPSDLFSEAGEKTVTADVTYYAVFK